MLCVVGDLLEDVVVHSSLATVRDTDNPSRIERRRGGSAANVAVAAAVLGAPVRFVGRVGDDDLGRRLERELTAAGVEAAVQRSGRTGSVVVVVEPGGGRTMYPDRAAAAELGPIDESAADGVTWLHLPAYSLCAEPIGASTTAFVQRVRAAGARLSVDVSSAALVDGFGATRVAALLRALAADVVLGTVEELTVVLGAAPGARSEPSPLGALTVVKDGPHPVLLLGPDESTRRVPVAPVDNVVDSTGAGDAFAAGFVVATMGGAILVDAVGAGAQLAARTLQVAGATIAAE